MSRIKSKLLFAALIASHGVNAETIGTDSGELFTEMGFQGRNYVIDCGKARTVKTSSGNVGNIARRPSNWSWDSLYAGSPMANAAADACKEGESARGNGQKLTSLSGSALEEPVPTSGSACVTKTEPDTECERDVANLMNVGRVTGLR